MPRRRHCTRSVQEISVAPTLTDPFLYHVLREWEYNYFVCEIKQSSSLHGQGKSVRMRDEFVGDPSIIPPRRRSS